MNRYAVKCDVCDGIGYTELGRTGWIERIICEKCQGNGRLVMESTYASRGARVMAWIAVIILCGIGAYLIGHGGR